MATPNPGEAAEFAGARAAMYRVLATCLLFPPAREGPLPLGDACHHGDLAAIFPGEELARALRELRDCAPERTALRDEFHALLVVPGPRYVAPLASVHLDADTAPSRSRQRGLLAGPSTEAVVRFYAGAGFLLDGVAELPDHIGLELSFMALLCEREQQAWVAGDCDEARTWTDRQVQFLTVHLKPFVSALCSALDAASPSPYFRAVSALLQAVVRADALEEPGVAAPA